MTRDRGRGHVQSPGWTCAGELEEHLIVVAANLPNGVQPPAVHDKAVLRRQIRAGRRRRDAAELATAATALADQVDDLAQVRSAATVATYLSTGAEPPTTELLRRWRSRGVAVLLPVVLPDLDLDWALDDGRRRPGSVRGVEEPASPRLGPDAIAGADVVLVPALAVDRAGRRLGQGGGSFDRALTRTRPGVLVVALVHDDEVLDGPLPVEPHDREVDVVVTPTRRIDVRRG